MARRKVLEILQYDYSTLEELEKHAKEMKERGYERTTEGYNVSNHKFTTMYVKDMLVQSRIKNLAQSMLKKSIDYASKLVYN